MIWTAVTALTAYRTEIFTVNDCTHKFVYMYMLHVYVVCILYIRIQTYVCICMCMYILYIFTENKTLRAPYLRHSFFIVKTILPTLLVYTQNDFACSLAFCISRPAMFVIPATVCAALVVLLTCIQCFLLKALCVRRR